MSGSNYHVDCGVCMLETTSAVMLFLGCLLWALQTSLQWEQSAASVDACAINASLVVQFVNSWCSNELGMFTFVNNFSSVNRGVATYWNSVSMLHLRTCREVFCFLYDLMWESMISHLVFRKTHWSFHYATMGVVFHGVCIGITLWVFLVHRRASICLDCDFRAGKFNRFVLQWVLFCLLNTGSILLMAVNVLVVFREWRFTGWMMKVNGTTRAQVMYLLNISR
jgi:hypothetical protein